MKKFLITVICAIALFATPSIMAYVTTCGYEVTTVEKEAFEDPKDADEYFKLLDDIYCNNNKE